MKKLFIFTVLLMIIIFLVLSCLVFFSDYFDTKEIKVIGSSIYSEKEILEITQINYYDKAPITYFRYLYEKIKDKKKEYLNKIYLKKPYIEDISVNYILPNEININVIERYPVAIIKLDNSFVLTDSNAFALEIVDNTEDYSDYIIIEGFAENSFRLGREIILDGDIDIKHTYDIVGILKSIDEEYEYGFIADLYKIEVLPNGIIILIFNNNFKVKLNIKDDINYKIKFAGKIIYESKEKPTLGVLDATLINPTIILDD